VAAGGDNYTLSNGTANTNVTATFTPNSYTVTFNSHGGTAPSPGTKPVLYDAAYDALATTSRTGYAFDGWFTASTGGSEVTAITIVSTASDHTLYAHWTAYTYTVGYVADPIAGGSVSGPESIAHDGTPGDTITVSAAANSGWSIDSVNASNGTIAFVSGSNYLLSGVTGNTTVTARFVEIVVEGEGASEGEGIAEGAVEGAAEGEGEGVAEGEGEGQTNCDPAVERYRTVTVGQDICLAVENACNATDGDFTWTFTPEGGSVPETIPDESSVQLCFTNIQPNQAGTYVALFDNGAAKVSATYTVVLTVVVTGLPIGALGLGAAAGIVALGGAFALRRRKR